MLKIVTYMTMCQNQSKQVVKVRYRYYGINKCKSIEPFLSINWTSQPMIMKKKKCSLIIVAVSGDRNVIKEQAEKILKYKDLNIEIQLMWNMTAKVIPLIIWTIGTISKSSRQNQSNITGKKEIKDLQKTAMLGTEHTLRKVLM